jgi:predicted Zn-dependent peptidase
LSGKIPPNAREILENLLGNWPLSKQSPRVLFTKKTSIVKIHIPKKGALQSAIKIGCVSLTPHDKDYFELKFLSVVLGGYFGSRLMNNIREDKGLTYGIGAMCVQKEEAGCFVISTEVKGESVQLALTEIYKELKRLREELIPQEEINLVKSYVMGQILAASDGSFAQAKLLKNLHTNALDFDFYKSYQIVLNELNPQSLMDMANKYLKEEDLCEVVVGVIS